MAGLHRAGALLLAHGKAHIWSHSQAVAEAIAPVARTYRLDVKVCREAALCHDLGGIYGAADMLDRARKENMPLDPAELRYPFLLHQRFSRMLCREALGIQDERILDAVACHTTLRPDATPYDLALFIADKLAWDQQGEPPFMQVVLEALEVSMETAALAYMEYVIAHGMLLMPHAQFTAARAWLQTAVE